MLLTESDVALHLGGSSLYRDWPVEETADEARGLGDGATGDDIIVTLSQSGAAAWLPGRAIISSNERPTTNLFGIGACRSRIPTGAPA
jgi:hypothetical protein